MLGGTPGVSDRRRPLLPVHGKDGIWRMPPEHCTGAAKSQQPPASPSSSAGGHHGHHHHHHRQVPSHDHSAQSAGAGRHHGNEQKPAGRRGHDHQRASGGDKHLQSQSATMHPTLLSAAPTAPGKEVKGAATKPPHSRLERLLESAAEMAESSTPLLAQALRFLAPVAAPLGDWALVIGRGYITAFTWLYSMCSKTPYELQAATGLVLCFFGGTFVALFAAVEAFRKMGFQRLQVEVQYIIDQAALVEAASEADDLKDENADGIADVDQMDARQLLRQKLHVAMMSIEDPQRLEAAVSSLWAACLGALATLKLQFAQTVAYALAFAEMLKLPALRLLAPALSSLLGKELQHWVETILEVLLKAVLILTVWLVAKAQGAVYACLRGGTMFGVAFLKILEERGVLRRLCNKPFDPESSYLDEILGFSMAALGFYWQLSSSFLVPWPMSWLLWPLTALETFLELQISWQ
eukprot:s158_g32.t1